LFAIDAAFSDKDATASGEVEIDGCYVVVTSNPPTKKSIAATVALRLTATASATSYRDA
jgi:hypothetical protein